MSSIIDNLVQKYSFSPSYKFTFAFNKRLSYPSMSSEIENDNDKVVYSISS